MTANNEYTLWFEQLGRADVGRVGGKNASLGEMIANLKTEGVRVPDGFATTATAYREYIAANGLEQAMRDHIRAMHDGSASLHEAGEAIRQLILGGEFPSAIGEAIDLAYQQLSERLGLEQASVAVRSSTTAEDLPDASFAGQQETFLNVRGQKALLCFIVY